jgi:quercetin dioxygenase-like cupin family protein
MSTAVPIIRGEGEGERRWFAGGGVHIIKTTAEETKGAFILLEDRMAQGETTPLHSHPNLDETLIVLEGEILVYARGPSIRLGRVVLRWIRAAFHMRLWSPQRAR